MNKTWVITGSRADYGCLKYLIEKSNYMHVEIKIGHESADRFLNYKHGKIDISIQENTISKMVSQIIKEFEDLYHMFRPEKIVVLGDRWEIFAACIPSIFFDIDIYHIGGGEITKGSYDNILRYSISNMAKYHFVIDEQAKVSLKKRNFDNIYVVGSPRLDFDKVSKKKFDRRTALVILHPETNSKNVVYKEFYQALIECDLDYIVIGPNIDQNSRKIELLNADFSITKNVKILHELPLDEYLELLNSVDVLIGNSSAGIQEAASFELPVVNVGDRQTGRYKQKNIIDVNWDKEDIKKGIIKALTLKFKKSLDGVGNIYYNNASEKIINLIG